MSKGWIKGTKEFPQAVLADLTEEAMQRVSEAEAAEMREPRWEKATAELLQRMGRSEAELATTAKGVARKVSRGQDPAGFRVQRDDHDALERLAQYILRKTDWRLEEKWQCEITQNSGHSNWPMN